MTRPSPDHPTGRRWSPRGAVLVVGTAALMLLSACAAGPNAQAGAPTSEAGFWLGLWHGLILPITFVVSLFTPAVSVYEVSNTGGWYDFGFFLGVATAFSGGGHASGTTRRRRR